MSTDRNLQRQFYEMLMESQWWSTDQIRGYQRSQLGQLLHHARTNVPFYERRLDAALKPNGDVDWERWLEIPIVTRRDMIVHRDAMQARELPRGHGPTAVLHTSGSTGVAIDVTVSAIGAIANTGLRWRANRWQELDWSKTLCVALGDQAHAHHWPDGEPKGFWGPPWDASARQGGAWKLSRSFDSSYLFEFMKEHDCAYLNTGPNMAHINALDARRLGIEVRIEAILVQGNVVHQADRDICREVFGAKLVEFYSSKEGGQIAHPCNLGRLHVNSETCLVEVLDENDVPVKPGEQGRVIVTPIFETAQPLIRYDQGDLVTLGDDCPCGRKGPTILAVHGRSIAIFRHPDGTAVAKLMPEDTAAMLSATRWQLAQVGPLAFEMRYMPVSPDAYADESSVREIFSRTYFLDAELIFVRSDDIASTHAGKVAEYINEWNPVK